MNKIEPALTEFSIAIVNMQTAVGWWICMYNLGDIVSNNLLLVRIKKQQKAIRGTNLPLLMGLGYVVTVCER
jgi:hypothetical protein